MSLVSLTNWNDDEDWDDDGDDVYAIVVADDYSTAIIVSVDELVNTLLFYAHEIYYWLTDVAPVLIKAQLRQLGRNAIDNLPLLSWEVKQEIKRWLIDHVGL